MDPCNKTHTGDCEGEVVFWLRPSDRTSWPKCERHADEAAAEFERINETYGVTSDVAPDWIDPTYCGEVWDDE